MKNPTPELRTKHKHDRSQNEDGTDSDSDLDTKIKRLLSKPKKQVEPGTSGPDFQRPKRRAVEEKKPAERGQPFVEFEDRRLQNRCAPIHIGEAVKELTTAQRICVEEMGFGSMLSLKVSQTPTALGYWLLMNYNNRLNELNIGSCVIKITPQKVHEVLGIPMGKIPVLGKNRPRLGEDVTTDMFKSQFPKTARISVQNVKDKLRADKGVGELFKINFLVLVNTCIGFVTKSTTVNQRFIAAIDQTSDIPNMDWCSYVIENLMTTKEEWRGIDKQYTGPITFLVMLYTHEFQKKYGSFGTPVTTPAVNYITTTTLNKMEKYLENNGVPLEEDAAAAAVTCGHDGEEIDAAAAVTVSAGGNGLDETADAAVADTAAVTVSAAEEKQEHDGQSASETENADQTAELDLDVNSWNKAMDNKMKTFDKICSEINELVRQGKAKHPSNENILLDVVNGKTDSQHLMWSLKHKIQMLVLVVQWLLRKVMHVKKKMS